MKHYDLVVLGSGSAARDAAAKACQRYGAKVALVESTRWGGSCPNVACKPTKAYLVVAELVHDINELAGKLGIDVGPAKVDMARVKARKDSIRKPQDKWVEDLQGASFDTYEGEAELVDAHTVRVAGEELTAERLLIATGSRTAVPPIDGIDEIDWIDHVSALELTELPESMLVVGGGPVGLEFAQIFARFGSRVTLVQGAARISPRSDAQAAAVLQSALEEDDGVEIVLSSVVESVRRDGDEVVATIVPMEGEGSREVRVTTVLLASGRAPNVESLHLDELGIEHDRSGILADDHMRTSVDGIWAAGDVTGRYQFTPIAQYQARIAVDDMFGGDPTAGGLLGAADGDLHGARARGSRDDRGRGARRGARFRRRGPRHQARPALGVQGSEARALQDPLRAGLRPAARPARRRAERERDRPGLLARAAIRSHRRRPRPDAPRLPDLRRRRQGGGRASVAAAGRDGHDLQLKRALQVPSPADPKACRT